MRVESVAVGVPRTVTHRGKDIKTAIFKTPVVGPVAVAPDNLAGDRQADLNVHGGRDKAIYAYPLEHYAYWRRELGRDTLEPAQFGENLVVSGLPDTQVVLGSRYRMGTSEVVITQPRLPCFKLGIRVGDDRFPARFLSSGRLGYYLRVETSGEIQRGDPIELLETADHGITAEQLWRAVFGGVKNRAVAAAALGAVPYLDEGWQRRLRQLVG